MPQSKQSSAGRKRSRKHNKQFKEVPKPKPREPPVETEYPCTVIASLAAAYGLMYVIGPSAGWSHVAAPYIAPNTCTSHFNDPLRWPQCPSDSNSSQTVLICTSLPDGGAECVSTNPAWDSRDEQVLHDFLERVDVDSSFSIAHLADTDAEGLVPTNLLDHPEGFTMSETDWTSFKEKLGPMYTFKKNP